MIPEGVNTFQPKLREFRVAILFNQQEIRMGEFTAVSDEAAVELCKKRIPASKHFNLFATEVEL